MQFNRNAIFKDKTHMIGFTYDCKVDLGVSRVYKDVKGFLF